MDREFFKDPSAFGIVLAHDTLICKKKLTNVTDTRVETPPA